MNKNLRTITIGISTILLLLSIWYLRSILLYVILALVVSLIGRPFFKLITKRKFIPDWLASIITISLMLGIFVSLFFFFSPLISSIITKIASINTSNLLAQTSIPLLDFNQWLIKTIPSLGDNFKIEALILDYIKSSIDISIIQNTFSSITGAIIDLAIGIFSVVFISFFFIKNQGLATNFIAKSVSAKYEKNVRHASKAITDLLERYFIGILLESTCITILNTLGLTIIAQMDFSLAVVIGLTTGILNIIPYVGPLCGHIVAVLMGLVTYGTMGIESSLGLYLLVILAICVVTQFIDNYLFQPLIYSKSVKAHPLEIFIIILIGGHIEGIVGMLVAIPSYIVIRVIAVEFFSHFRFVQNLVVNPNTDKEESQNSNNTIDAEDNSENNA
ncbi:MAG: AI-2E family transporter [Bacteroidales bacterium]